MIFGLLDIRKMPVSLLVSTYDSTALNVEANFCQYFNILKIFDKLSKVLKIFVVVLKQDLTI